MQICERITPLNKTRVGYIPTLHARGSHELIPLHAVAEISYPKKRDILNELFRADPAEQAEIRLHPCAHEKTSGECFEKLIVVRKI